MEPSVSATSAKGSWRRLGGSAKPSRRHAPPRLRGALLKASRRLREGATGASIWKRFVRYWGFILTEPKVQLYSPALHEDSKSDGAMGLVIYVARQFGMKTRSLRHFGIFGNTVWVITRGGCEAYLVTLTDRCSFLLCFWSTRDHT